MYATFFYVETEFPDEVPIESFQLDDTIRFRVEVARLPIWYVKLATNRVTGDAKAELLRRFLSVARKAGISNISESRSLDDWAKRMGAE